MRGRKINLTGIIIILLVLGFIVYKTIGYVAPKNYPKQDLESYVNDYAKVISSGDNADMQSIGKDLQDKTKAQIVVLTVDTLDGEDIDDYAIEIANRWQLGDRELNNGVLICLAKNDRKIKVEIGSGLEGALPDGKVGRLIDRYALEHLKSNRFSKGITALYKALAGEVYAEYNLSPPYSYNAAVKDGAEQNEADVKDFIVPAVIFILFIAIFIIARKGGGPGRRGGLPFIFFGGPRGGGFPGGGGFSGGGFSGGGGGFSGGGAGRSF